LDILAGKWMGQQAMSLYSADKSRVWDLGSAMGAYVQCGYHFFPAWWVFVGNREESREWQQFQLSRGFLKVQAMEATGMLKNLRLGGRKPIVGRSLGSANRGSGSPTSGSKRVSFSPEVRNSKEGSTDGKDGSHNAENSSSSTTTASAGTGTPQAAPTSAVPSSKIKLPKKLKSSDHPLHAVALKDADHPLHTEALHTHPPTVLPNHQTFLFGTPFRFETATWAAVLLHQVLITNLH
jgi:hypothetical protein